MAIDPNDPPQDAPPISSDGYFKAYDDLSKSLRTWFVAYGIGGPVLILNNAVASKAIADSGHGKEIALCFLGGVALQILLATLNKNAMWGLYWGYENKDFERTLRFALCEVFARQFWIDLLVDIVTLGLFGWATYRVFSVLVI